MTTTEFENIKNKMKQLELGAATAKGKIETIESGWQKKYGFSTLEEAKKKREELKTDIAEKTEKRNELMDKLEKSFDWDSV